MLNKLYFLQELAPNGELFTFMKNEEVLQFAHARFLAAEILSMIEYLRSKKICHRDFKPSNLLFNSEMRLKLADFGSAKSYKGQEGNSEEDDNRQSGGSTSDKWIRRMNSFVGTVEYMAPEVIQGASRIDGWDLWSLGIIIYKFFAETSPFIGEFDEDTIRKIEEEDLVFPENFPDVAKDICKRLLVKNPEERLGCGRHGTELDMFSLKAHPFFDGIDFDNLENSESPVPIPTVLKSSVKVKIIEELKKSANTSTNVTSPWSIDMHNFTTAWKNVMGNNLSPWKTLKEFHQNSPQYNIRVLFQGPIKYRSRLLIKYNSATAIFTDEPAFYLYSQTKGVLKTRYSIQNYYFSQKNKTKFYLKEQTSKNKQAEASSEEDTSHKPSKFKTCVRKVTDEATDSPSDLIFLLSKYCAQE